ncbi:type II secretion system secretin GspD [Undibacterium sp. 14-3-2]|uniref:type II secretion system secretin GspD n=1 Tax=Undibacterium sp. 14-3-2 TaxID=2800129 RepID=UPI0019048A5C|nr:type II secretion system secretin GspD [Undibacterium sp. 14-3-2]MBK1891573.1 type II secretion system secretin GspD [Undibacterium sp. 14-3-2]
MISNSLRKPMRHLSVMTGAAVLSAGCLISSSVLAQTPAQNTADLNFVGADIESVVKAIGHYTGSTFIIDPRVKGQVTLVSEKPLTKEQAFKLLTSTLRLQGYAVVYADGYYKVVPESDAKLQPGPTQSVQNEKGESVRGDQVATQIYRLNYESATNVVTILRPLISPNNTINANPGNNSVVITDYADNLKRLNKIIASLDVPATVDMDVIPIKHAMASDIAALVSKLSDNGAATEGGRAVLLADPRTNSVLLRAPSAARANLVKELIAKLDQPTALPGNVHVVYLKNAEAVKLAQTLRSIISGDTSALPASTGLSNTGSSANGTNSPLTSNSNTGTSNTGVTGGLPQSSGSSSASGNSGGAAGFIQADAATNTLIITASEAVYKNLRSVIDQLDARRAQVYVEALIVEISADKANEFGVQWLGLSGDSNSNYRVGGGTAFTTTGNNILSLATAATPTPGNGLSIGVFKQINGKLGLGAVAHILNSSGNANILSMPNLVTLDNEEAKIVVGKNVPFITGQFTTSASTGTAGVNPFQTIERKEVGLKLTVKPQISEGGTVKLAIYQESSSIDESATVTSSGLITKQRSISTNVLVEDGQILALGGLMEDSTSDSVEKVTGLADIPVIGNLFKYQTAKRGKTNLMVFLRPTVIRNADQSNSVSVDRYDYMRTQIAPNKDGVPAAQLPEMEKGKLMSTSTSLPSDKPKSGGQESK